MADGTQNTAFYEVVTYKKGEEGMLNAYFGNAVEPEKWLLPQPR